MTDAFVLQMLQYSNVQNKTSTPLIHCSSLPLILKQFWLYDIYFYFNSKTVAFMTTEK